MRPVAVLALLVIAMAAPGSAPDEPAEAVPAAEEDWDETPEALPDEQVVHPEGGRPEPGDGEREPWADTPEADDPPG